MNRRKVFHFIGAGAAVLGLALCVPAAMLAQSTNQSQDSGMASQSNSQGAMDGGMHHHRGSSPDKQLKRLTKMLNLTPDQQQQMKPILQDLHSKMMAMQNDTSISPQQRRDQRRTLMMDTHQKLEAIMTDSQKQKFEQKMQQHRDRMRHGGMNGSGSMGNPPPPDNGTPPPPPPQ
jgi:protein CpxP